MSLDSPSPYIAANSPCADCSAVPGCASSELTAQCTDQCVVIVCNDPDHGEASCGGDAEYAQCDPACSEIYNCNGFDAFVSLSLENAGLNPYLSLPQLECCDDYHQKFGESRQVPLDAPPFVWAPVLDDFWCACGQSDAPKAPANQERPADTPSDVSLSPIGHVIQSPLFEVPAADIDLTQTTFQLDPYSSQGFPKPQYMHGCMWGNCTASFSSLSELRDHVVLVHLESSPSDDSPSNHHITAQDSPQWPLDTPCLWSKCDNSYQPHSMFTSPQSLYKHLMSDHLGVWSSVNNNSQLPTQTEPPTQNTFDEMSPISHHGSTFESVISQDDSSSSNSTTTIFASSEDCNSATHRCHWKDCSFYFSTCNDLTTHITSDHIGGGKAHYECFWEGCTRNGDQGFQSKQKICRHVQVKLLLFLFSQFLLRLANLYVVSYRTSTIPMFNLRAEILGGCNPSATHPSAYTRK